MEKVLFNNLGQWKLEKGATPGGTHAWHVYYSDGTSKRFPDKNSAKSHIYTQDYLHHEGDDEYRHTMDRKKTAKIVQKPIQD